MSISNMGSVPIKMMLFLILQVWFIQYVSPNKTYDQRLIRHSGRSLLSDYDFMYIDCGAPQDYYDKQKRHFDNDTKYINTGEVSQMSSEYLTKDLWPEFKYLRSFPKGKRNCYTLPLKQGKNVNYLITAFFQYGNYDNKFTPPEFDLYIGVNRWSTLKTNYTLIFRDVIYLATTDSVDLCLVNTNSGTPFISALQLRPLVSDSFYQTSSGNLLRLIHRYDCGSLFGDYFSRYKNDVYERMWDNSLPESNSIRSWTSYQSDFVTVYDEQPAPTVLKTYVQPTQQGTWMNYYFNKLGDPTSEFAVYLHFAGVLQSSAQRSFTVTINGNVDGPFNFPESMKTLYVSRNTSVTGNVHINISATDGSQFSPILNALEIFMVVPTLDSPSNQEDVTAMTEIKRTYGVTEESWQGDPCVPKDFSWSKVGCNSDKPPRIISLDLSSSGLTGDITPSISNLKSIRVLDLSYNNLTGSIPESLAELSSLKVLNLTGNKLEGSVPQAILEKSKTGALKLRLDENPKLCYPDPCKHKKNKAITLGIGIVAAVVLILIFGIVILLLCFRKRNGQGVKMLRKKMSWKWKPRGRRFKHSDIMNITKDLTSSNFLGEGAFGKVYLGELEGTQVAVKVCSNISSAHRTEQFENEVQLLTSVNHKNVVSLIGYCYENDTIALVYEYMSNGNLDEHITADTKRVLTWKERLQIALDAARGPRNFIPDDKHTHVYLRLAYLHKDGNEPIVHRDLKPQNILLNDNVRAKIADFGISKLFVSDMTHVTTDPKGTTGYLDPEYMTTKQLNSSSDVYSFGVILLQLITGKGANIYDSASGPNGSHISQWIAGKNIESIVDPKLQAGTYNIDSVRQAMETAMACVKYTKIERPDVTWVCSELENALKTETTLRTEYFTSQTFEINRMDTENQKTEGNVRTWLLSILNWF